MTPKDFTKGFYDEKAHLLKTYFDTNQGSEVGILIRTLDLEVDQIEILKKILNNVITDSLYTVLLGLDGAASIGGQQEMYKLLDENGNELTGGEIESYAWEYFHGKEK